MPNMENVLLKSVIDLIEDAISHKSYKTATTMIHMLLENEAWRIEVRPSGQIDAMHIGMNGINSDSMQSYPSIDDVPDWISDKVHVLRMINDDLPSYYVKGVGRRIGENIYYIDEEVPDAEV